MILDITEMIIIMEGVNNTEETTISTEEIKIGTQEQEVTGNLLFISCFRNYNQDRCDY